MPKKMHKAWLMISTNSHLENAPGAIFVDVEFSCRLKIHVGSLPSFDRCHSLSFLVCAFSAWDAVSVCRLQSISLSSSPRGNAISLLCKNCIIVRLLNCLRPNERWEKERVVPRFCLSDRQIVFSGSLLIHTLNVCRVDLALFCCTSKDVCMC